MTNIDINCRFSYYFRRGDFYNYECFPTPKLENSVNKKLNRELYNSAGKVVRKSLRLLQKQAMLKQIRRDELCREIMPGVEIYRVLHNSRDSVRIFEDVVDDIK